MRWLIVALIILTAAFTVAARASSVSEVRHLDAAVVTEAFREGAPLIEVPGYKIHASRRVAPGQAEVHLRDTDIIHVLEGSAELVTGGLVLGGASTGDDEIRGRAIEGGTPRTLEPGDVIVVPDGVPHWFRRVTGPFLYYVVKVPTGDGGGR